MSAANCVQQGRARSGPPPGGWQAWQRAVFRLLQRTRDQMLPREPPGMHVPRNLVPLLSDSLSLEPIGGPTQVRCKPLAQPVRICRMCSLQLHALESARPARIHCHSWAQDAVPGRLQLSMVPAMQSFTCNAAKAFEMKGAESFCLFPYHDSDRKVSKCLGKACSRLQK